jgi:hypothetical protein
MNKKLFVIRLAVSTLFGLSVFAVSVLAVWRRSPTTLMTNSIINSWTWSSVRRVDKLIQERIESHGNPPPSLDEFSVDLEGETLECPNVRMKILKRGTPVDGWGRALIYSVNETSYTLKSYGRDGRPGGTGFDRDIDLGDDSSSSASYGDGSLYANPPMPTLKQFLFELPTKGMIHACALSGLIAFAITFMLLRPARPSRRNDRRLAFQIAVTLVVSVIFAMMIMQLHIPTGH